MVEFSNVEYADIHFIYGYCNGNATAAVREYHRRYPNRRLPSKTVFTQTHMKFRNFGLQKNRRNEVRRNERLRNEILAQFNDNNKLSVRRAVQQLRAGGINVSKNKVLRVLKNDHRKPFRMQPVQNLQPGDAERRVEFCNWFINAVEEDPDFMSKIIWTDEATFTRSGSVNFHNSRIWAHENPHTIRPTAFQTDFCVNVWCGVINGTFCGPHILPPRLNGQLFHEFLNNSFFDYLEDVPLNLRNNCWLQMDGAPAHYAIENRRWLNNNFPERWIGRLGPIGWPPRSPDLTPVDFFVWGYLKDKVYATPVNTREELIQKIREACEELRANQNFINAATHSLVRRCQKCVEVEGLHFEQLI